MPGHLQIRCIKLLWVNFLNPSVLSQVFLAHVMNFHTWSQSAGTLNSVWNGEARFIPLFSLPHSYLVDFSFVVCAWKWNIEAQMAVPWYLPTAENAGSPLSHVFSLTRDVVSVVNAMNELKNLISAAANSFDRSEENKVFLYPGHSKLSSISSKICIVSTSVQGSLVIKTV